MTEWKQINKFSVPNRQWLAETQSWPVLACYRVKTPNLTLETPVKETPLSIAAHTNIMLQKVSSHG